MKGASGRPYASKSLDKADDIQRIRKMLRKNPRDLLFYELAIRTGLHAKDLLKLTVADLDGLKPGEEFNLHRIPKASNRIVMTPTIHRIFSSYVLQAKLSGGDSLFRSQKGGRPLTLVSLSRLVRNWFEAVGLPGMGGALTLRRTWQHHFGAGRPKSTARSSSRKQQTLHPKQSMSRRDAVFRELQGDIVSGRIIPGYRLFIESISRKMGVSAIPVREALALLEAGGFVHSDKKRGYLVNELSESSLREILELRLLLEGKAAELAAVRRSDDAISRLEEYQRLYQIARVANNAEELLRTNKEFHHAIYREAGMPILKSHIDQLWDRVSPYYHIMFSQIEKPNPVVGIQYHQLMIEAIKKKNPKEVRRWIRADLTDSTLFVIDLFKIHKKLLEHS